MSDGSGETLLDGAPEGPQLATGNRPTTFWWRRTQTVSSVPPLCRYMLRRNDVEALFDQPVPWSRRSGRPRGELDAVMNTGTAITRRLLVAVSRLWAVDLLAMLGRRAPAVPVGTYTTWSWPPTPTGYAEFRWALEPRTDPSPVGYFWSHQVALVGGEAAYVGLQTVGSEPAGKIAIFSVWGGIDAEGPDYAASFGGEGTGMTVRIRYGWVPGRRERLALRADGDGWWRAEVEGRLVGRIRVDPAWRGLTPRSIMWTERYTPPLRTCADMGYAVAWFGTPLADGGVAPRHHHNHLGVNRGCPGSSVHDTEGGVLHVMGAPG